MSGIRLIIKLVLGDVIDTPPDVGIFCLVRLFAFVEKLMTIDIE